MFFDSLNFGNFNCRSAGIIIDADQEDYKTENEEDGSYCFGYNYCFSHWKALFT